MTYTDKELMRAKEVLEACDFVSTSTKGCYSSRIALWMHYCAQRCGGDERVTEERLADYVEWMVTSGSAERIRQGSTHVQQVLRNQLQGVLCYWRLQNGNRADLPDPRVGHIFMSKWQQIVMRFPRPRQSRRSEPIYGVPKGSSGSESTDEYGAAHPNGTPPINLRPTFGVIGNGVIHPIGQPGQVLGSSQAIHRHRYPTVKPEYTQTHSYRSNSPLYPHENIDNSYRPCSPVYPQGHIAQQQQHHQHQNQQHHQHQNQHHQQQNQQQQQGRLLKPLQRPNQLSVPINSRMSPPETLEAIPIVKYVSKPSYPTSGQQFSLSQAPLQVAPLNADVSSSTRAGSRFSPTTDDEGRHSVTDQDSNKLKLSQPASPSVSRSPQIDTDETMVPGSPNMDAETEKLLGVVPEVIPKWQKSDESLTEGNLLTLKESIVLNARQLEMGSNAQSQARTHRCLGISTWMSSGARTNLTLTDVSMDEALNTATTPQQAIMNIPASGDKTTHVDKPFAKCIAVTVHHSAKNTLAGLKPGKAAIMRHANPLLCSWNALAFELFRRWHVANEAIPDFATAEWQSLKLFPRLSDGSELSMEVDQVTRTALAGISKDTVTGSKLMSDIGYFYADAFKLVRPTADGIKGLNCVNTLDSNAILPEVLDVLLRVNAGYDLEAGDAGKMAQRFSIIPPLSLQKEVFPWIKPLLMNAFGQNDNNEDVRSATRFLRLLKELRVVLLQDAAFMIEMPSMSKAVETNPLFSHVLFGSDEFKVYREQLRVALAKTDIKAADNLLASALQHAEDYRSKYPNGYAKRMEATGPLMPPPKVQPVVPKPEVKAKPAFTLLPSVASIVDSAAQSRAASPQQRPLSILPRPLSPQSNFNEPVERKRARSPTRLADVEPEYAYGPGTDSVGSMPKRSRRVYDAITNGTMGQVYGNVHNRISPRSATHINPAQPPVEVATAIDELRMENDDLKSQLRRLEYTFGQHRTEMRTWMGKMERVMHSVVGASDRSTTPPIDVSAPGHCSATGQRLPSAMSLPAAAAISRGPTHPSQLSQTASSAYLNRQQRMYSESHYQQQQQSPQPPQSQPPMRESFAHQERGNILREESPIGRAGMANSRPPIDIHSRLRQQIPPITAPARQAPGQQTQAIPSGGLHSPRRQSVNSTQFVNAAEYSEYRRHIQNSAAQQQQQQQQQQQVVMQQQQQRQHEQQKLQMMRQQQQQASAADRVDRGDQQWYQSSHEQVYSSRHTSPRMPNGSSQNKYQ